MFLCWGIRDVRAIDNRPGHFLRDWQDGNMQRRLYNNFGLTQHLGIPPKARPAAGLSFCSRSKTQEHGPLSRIPGGYNTFAGPPGRGGGRHAITRLVGRHLHDHSAKG